MVGGGGGGGSDLLISAAYFLASMLLESWHIFMPRGLGRRVYRAFGLSVRASFRRLG